MISIVTIRDAEVTDSDTIARLHVESWRSAYAEILSASYLAGPIETDRMSVWRDRMTSPTEDMKVMIAENKGAAIGFVCVFGNNDEQWGTLVDNLHILPKAKRRGVGRSLICAAARWSAENYPNLGLHLWVYEVNSPARAFYERMGGQKVARMPQSNPDGVNRVDVCYFWPDTNSFPARPG